ncbi:hypothetical protein J25TS5_00820 [Paenibacillus faecis]|nr:hypothetical protein J25TS5_00820 [Paenibacillus faecis]
MLVVIFGLALCLFALLYGTGRLLDVKERKRGYVWNREPIASSRLRSVFFAILLRSYAISVKTPLLRHDVLKVRQRLALLHRYDEFSLRRATMKFVILLALLYGVAIGLLIVWKSGIVFAICLLLAIAVIQGNLLDAYVIRMEQKLLEQMLDWFAAVRHGFHRHGMVGDAILESIDQVPAEIGMHAERLYEALTDSKPEEALDKFNETAPNRFLKMFAGISRLVMEFGDRKRERGSLYLRGISGLAGEIQLELLRRKRLEYLLQGLNIIALAPFFFTKPIERWARLNFPLMNHFYLSKTGLFVKIGLFIVILICYVLLQKLRGDRVMPSYRVSQGRKVPWEARLLRWGVVRKLRGIFTPPSATAAYSRLDRLLKDVNHHLDVGQFQVRRMTVFAACIILAIGTLIYMHAQSRNWILSEPPAGTVFFGTMSEEDSRTAAKAAEQDRRMMIKLGMKSGIDSAKIAEAVAAGWSIGGGKLDEQQAAGITQRILDKLERWNREYVKWWELILSLTAGCVGYFSPLWVLKFQRGMRLMDMRHEVYQFQTMISILRELERISVEEILEWLHTYAVIFKEPLQKCLLHYGHGGEDALREMKEQAALDEFRQLCDKLLLAAERITIRDAFDELDGEMSYQFERRRLDYEKSLDLKAGWGRLLGFCPMYCLIFAYLVIPLIWMSFEQMDIYFKQIQHI